MPSRSADLRVLHALNPHCHWCGRLTVLGQRLPGERFRLRPEDATRDHLLSALKYGRQVWRQSPVVLACHQCNHDRNSIETKQRAGKPVAHLLASVRRTESSGLEPWQVNLHSWLGQRSQRYRLMMQEQLQRWENEGGPPAPLGKIRRDPAARMTWGELTALSGHP